MRGLRPLLLAMRLRDGKQDCPRCQGRGCYRCHKHGYLVQCPVCMNSELELIGMEDDKYRCGACGAFFDQSGDVVIAS